MNRKERRALRRQYAKRVASGYTRPMGLHGRDEEFQTDRVQGRGDDLRNLGEALSRPSHPKEPSLGQQYPA